MGYGEYTLERIKGMTEHEVVYALCKQDVTPEQVTASWGDFPRTTQVIGEYESYKFSCENTDIYWDEKIDRLKEQIRQLEDNKRDKIQPSIPYGY